MKLSEIKTLFTEAEKAQRDERKNSDFPWDEREDLFNGVYKDYREETKAILSTGELTSIIIDGACRVMAQLPTGRFVNKNGKTLSATAMNLLFENYVIPNAITGGDLLQKFRVADMYSRVFPLIPVFIDWRASEDEDAYTGPDLVLAHPRRFYWQPGKISPQDMDWCFLDVEVSKGWFEELNKDVWKVEEIIKKLKTDPGQGTPDEDRSPKERGKTKNGVTVRHFFEKDGSWTVYVPNYGETPILQEKKYFCGLPIDIKGQYPTLDSICSLNDMSRGQMIQKSIDSVVRMALDSGAMSIKPPVLVDDSKMTLASVVMQPGAVWYGQQGAVQVQTINPQAMNAFQTMYGMLKGNLLSLGAQQDTSVSMSIDAGMGKTPEAIRAQGAKQGARDAWDMYMMERFIERVYTFMANMIAKKKVGSYAFQLIGNSLKKLQERYPEQELVMFIRGDDRMEIDEEYLKGEWRYVIDEGTTGIKKDSTGEKMMSYIETYNKFPGIAEDFAMSGMKFNQGEAFKRAIIDDGVQDSDKIIVQQEDPESVAGVGEEGATAQMPMEGMPMEGMAEQMPVGMPAGMPMPMEQMPQEQIPSELLTR